MENVSDLYNKKSKSLCFYLKESKNPFMLLRWSKHFILNLAANEAFLQDDIQNSADFLFPDFKLKLLQILEKYSEIEPADVPAFFETFRSNKRQFYLFQNGKTKIKSYGMHYYGIAVDLINFKNNLVRWSLNYDEIIRLAKLNGLTSLRPFEDCHLQFIPVESQNAWRSFARNLTICIQDLVNVKTDGIIGPHTFGQILTNYKRLEYYFSETEKTLLKESKYA